MYSTRNTLNMVLHLAHPGLKIVYGNPSQDIDLHINISIRRSIMLGGTKMLNSVGSFAAMTQSHLQCVTA